MQCKHRRDGGTTFPRDPDLKLVSHALEQVSEPRSRLRQQTLAPPGPHEKPVELVHEFFRTAHFIR